VVDDSAVVRQTLQHLLQGDPEIELMGSAPNPLIAGPADPQEPRPTCCCSTSRCPAWTA
jgi:DNA-binding NarL/FixJ family response regulator